MLLKLIDLADHLDSQGLTAEASSIDALIKKYSMDPSKGEHPRNNATEEAIIEISNHHPQFEKDFELNKWPDWQKEVYGYLVGRNETDNVNTANVKEALVVLKAKPLFPEEQ